jgi:hypothetical protein
MATDTGLGIAGGRGQGGALRMGRRLLCEAGPGLGTTSIVLMSGYTCRYGEMTCTTGIAVFKAICA